jgi:hypothetical protein
LNHLAIARQLGTVELAVDITDQYVGKEIFYRGFVLKCGHCADVAWFPVDEITNYFTCKRCGKKQQYRKENWKYPNEPAWFYKLDEIVYQALRHNSGAPILTLAALKRGAKESFLFCPELRITPQHESKHFMELDICCITDGKLCIGEAKSNGIIESTDVSRYADIASKLAATRVVFSTTASSWNKVTEAAIDSTFNSLPIIEVSKWVASDLGLNNVDSTRD